MNLSISNIAWGKELDPYVYNLMQEYGFSGLEIAPTRVFPSAPYDDPAKAVEWKKTLKEQYGFEIPSMQSIWYGRAERIFGTEEERQVLLDYTKKAILFAEAIDCGNLVFGCPKNRSIPDSAKSDEVIPFFREIGDYALEHHTVVSLEANPVIYNTNFLNTTQETIEFIKKVGSDGILLNLDIGTMVENGETIDEIKKCIHLIRHVHISEPGLNIISDRLLHRDVAELLRKEKYEGYISIEMGRQESIDVIHNTLDYVNKIFDSK